MSPGSSHFETVVPFLRKMLGFELLCTSRLVQALRAAMLWWCLFSILKIPLKSILFGRTHPDFCLLLAITLDALYKYRRI